MSSNNNFSKSDFELYFRLEPMAGQTTNNIPMLDGTTRTFRGRPTRGTETNNTPVAGANDTAIGADKLDFTFFTFPSTAPYFEVTGIEVLNGTVLDGNWSGVVYRVDANPPVLAAVNLLAYSVEVAQAGASAIQRNSQVSSQLIPAGTIVGAGIWTASATGRYGTTTVSSANNQKGLTYTANPVNVNTTAWTATTEEPYIKVYYRPVLGT